jgi:prolyl-tRNA synthetase
VQFADADLLGIPFRLIVSERNVKSHVVELKYRATGQSENIAIDTAVQTVKQVIENARQAIESIADQY